MTYKEFKEVIEKSGEYQLLRHDNVNNRQVNLYVVDNQEQLVFKINIVKTWYTSFAYNPNSKFHARNEEICKRFITTTYENKEL